MRAGIAIVFCMMVIALIAVVVNAWELMFEWLGVAWHSIEHVIRSVWDLLTGGGL